MSAIIMTITQTINYVSITRNSLLSRNIKYHKGTKTNKQNKNKTEKTRIYIGTAHMTLNSIRYINELNGTHLDQIFASKAFPHLYSWGSGTGLI
jgi:hypothetical protein